VRTCSRLVQRAGIVQRRRAGVELSGVAYVLERLSVAPAALVSVLVRRCNSQRRGNRRHDRQRAFVDPVLTANEAEVAAPAPRMFTVLMP